MRLSAPPPSRTCDRPPSAGGNTFASLMAAVRHASLGEITDALFEVGGRYRRNV